ncbi:hypothetical protein SCB71_06525 [Herbiconiux sp. KACC 21604]|uniref:hypothetical protein n=1 Tax=unclassified Herbiconiux TaxID=2618217 RepID=UPI0014927DA1|nr:hypothetical protein [Herbiconiux sp. SALV-R1]QJU52967.1 hypothetical protein HL652_04505 [Herbiconiux sp. SALV-R1]WPO87894.1 hypothetical protein SCB71_06525 [Herbiconiux sp. KACC 21604]
MEWWNGFARWLYSADGEYVVSSIVLPAAAIIVAGLIAAWVAHSAVKRLLAKHDRELRVSAIAALIDAAEQASVWNSLTPQEQILSDRATGQADIQVRLLPIKGSDVAANWAAHALAEMKRNSATFGYQIEPAVIEFRDRLVDWQQRPGRARKVFQSDLDRWAAQGDSAERELLAQQDAWVAQQHHNQYADQQGGSPAGAGAAAASPVGSGAPAASASSIGTPTVAVPVDTSRMHPSAPLPPTHEPRPTVQQVASGTGSRGVDRRATSNGLGDLELTTDPGESRAAGELPPPVNAFPPRGGSHD